MKPKILILDEATSAVDVETRDRLLALLKHLQETDKLTYLFITHDMQVIQQIANEVLVLKDGRIVEKGQIQTIFENPSQAYTQQLVEAALLEGKND